MPRALTEARAWEIAVAAGEALRGRVRLTFSGVGKREIVGRHDWIEIAVPEARRAARRSGASAHARVGYRGHENDVFWMRVADTVAKKPELPSTATEVEGLAREMFEMFQDDVMGPSVNDGYCFISESKDGEWSSTFPRFRVTVPFSVEFDELPDPEVTRRFWRIQGAMLPVRIYRRPVKEGKSVQENGSVHDRGLDDLEDGKEDEGEDTAIRSASDWFAAVVRAFSQAKKPSQNPSVVEFVKELLPYVDAKRYCEKLVDIDALMDEFYPLKHIARAIRGIISDGKAQNTTVEDSEFVMPYSEPLLDHRKLQQLSEIIETCEIVIPEVQFEPSAMIDDATLARFVRSLSGGRAKGSAMVQSLALESGKATPRQLEMLYSAMPIITVNRLALINAHRNLCRRGWRGSRMHSSTRGHGIHAGERSASKAQMSLKPWQSPCAVRTSVAQATLYSLLHGEDDNTAPEIDSDKSCGRYSIVDVQGGTACFASNSLLGKRLCSFKYRCRVTAVIKNSVVNVDDLDDVVCVIVPGCGRGWVAKSSIHAVTHLQSAGASIRGLKLGPAFADPTMELHVLAPLLQRVDSLDIFEWGRLNSTQMLELMQMCAHLTQLTAQHHGDVFTSWTVEKTSTGKRLQACRLKAVNLVCYQEFGSLQPPSQAAWKACLSERSSVMI